MPKAFATPARPHDLLVHRADEPKVVYRIVRGVNHNDPDMLDSLRSNYELGSRPRGSELESALIHLGLSMHLKREMAAATARHWRQIGQHIAQIQLEPGHGFCWAHTGHPGHITVWGRPLQLLDCIVDTLPIGD